MLKYYLFLNQGRVVSGCRIVRSEQAGSHRRPEENIRQQRKKGGGKGCRTLLIELFSMRTGAMILHAVIGGFPSNFVMGKMCVELCPPSSSKLGSPSGPEGLGPMREAQQTHP